MQKRIGYGLVIWKGMPLPVDLTVRDNYTSEATVGYFYLTRICRTGTLPKRKQS